ncbi:MAG: alpha/beta hydrolase-fold protein [Eubacteriales bacterium]|nr:alpha/beta hydrolase-fold protein [Eubacteriales bacterium]
MVKKWYVTIPRLTGDEKRRAYIYLPSSYRHHNELRYPVLYMFDGHNVFFDEDATYGKCWGMKEYMDYTRTQMIIVAIECNHSPDNSRLREYSPYDFSDPNIGNIKGKGRLTMNWIVNVLKPYIDRTYRTLPGREHTFIAGSSMGGLMSLYALLAYNRTFSRAAALSPSLWTNPERIRQLIQKTSIRRGTVLYMDYGSNEISNHTDMMKEYGKVCELLMQKKVLLTSRIVPNGNHSEASWEKQIPFFINTLLYDMKEY